MGLGKHVLNPQWCPFEMELTIIKYHNKGIEVAQK
jgi:hypothetical protein